MPAARARTDKASVPGTTAGKSVEDRTAANGEPGPAEGLSAQ